MTGDEFVPSDDLLFEQAYLVARGVRPMSLVGQCPSDPLTLVRVATRLESKCCSGSIPFVVDHGSSASFGYAAAAWVIDLYEWANDETLVPQEQRHQINGLLLGYGVPAVALHDAECSGRRFQPVTVESGSR